MPNSFIRLPIVPTRVHTSPYSLRMNTPSGILLNLVCGEFVDALYAQPTLRRKRKIGKDQIESTVHALQWDRIDISLPSRNDEDSSTLSTSMKPLTFPRNTESSSLSVLLLHSSQWKHSGATNTGRTSRASALPMAALPDGLKEFLLQLELAYAVNAESDPHKLSKDEVIRAVTSSEHLTIAFPHILKMFVNKIRTESSTADITEYLNVIGAIVGNKWYVVSTTGEFETVLNCLIGVVVDVNLMRPGSCFDEAQRVSVRRRAIDILSTLLQSKVGKFHSNDLIRGIFEKVLIPYTSRIVAMPSIQEERVWSGFAGAVMAMLQLGSGSARLGDLEKKIRSVVDVQISKHGRSWMQILQSDMLDS